ncbi:uncharacterized protein RHO25_003287 [Cercospora beticola]|uniref:Uncharacterized protein n=1 Tax=Cercospora beticola TaxID=122368 RepID=A0ABZ0NGL9_CERBT|nr:hypothetical protein RHO25_003287 [Cercospora beticola]
MNLGLRFDPFSGQRHWGKGMKWNHGDGMELSHARYLDNEFALTAKTVLPSAPQDVFVQTAERRVKCGGT